MALRYDVNDWYWQVLGDTNFWSSARFQYVDSSDSLFLAWVGVGGEVTSIASQDALTEVMFDQRIPPYLQGLGIQITSSSNPLLNSTYALDELSLIRLGNLARDIACDFGLPRSLTNFPYVDSSLNLVYFTSGEIIRFYVAARDYVAGVNLAVSATVHGTVTPIPVQPIEIG